MNTALRLPLWRLLATLLLMALLPPAWAQPLQPVPHLTARVMDTAALMSADERAALEAKLAAFEAEAGPQIVVLTVPDTTPEDIAAFAYRVASDWKIGRRDVGDGVLLIVSKNDRKMRIEVAKALEGAIPDLAARQIMDRAMRPAFREGDYAGGLSAAADQLMARIRGEHLPLPEPRGGSSAPSGGLDLSPLVIFFIAVPIIGSVLSGILGRKLGTVASAGATGGLAWLLTQSLLIAAGAAVVALILVAVMGVGSMLGTPGGGSRRMGRSSGGVPPIIWGGGGGGGGGGWGGGGGFSSGGGGDFGGGGASGDW